MPPKGKAAAKKAKPAKASASTFRNDEKDRKIKKQGKHIEDLKRVNTHLRAHLSDSRRSVRQRDASIERFACAMERVAKQLRRNTTKGIKETQQFNQECKERYEAWKKAHGGDLYSSSVEWQQARARAADLVQRDSVQGSDSETDSHSGGSPVQCESGDEDEDPKGPAETTKTRTKASQSGGPLDDRKFHPQYES